MSKPIGPADEGRHAPVPGAEAGLWGDTLWVSVVDFEANIFGVNHFHLTNKGYARYEALYIIDGVTQLYATRGPLDVDPDDSGPWSDGRLTYEVVRPLEEIRISFDGPRYGFDLSFTGRFPVFNYADCVRGDPLAFASAGRHGGHFEQGMHCRGEFEIRGGPAAGETRTIDCFSHRDHSWSPRFADEPAWEWTEGHNPGHFWPSIQLPDRHINAFGLIDSSLTERFPEGQRPVGGFVSDADGGRALLNATCEVLAEGAALRDQPMFRYELTMPDGEVIHVRTVSSHGAVKLWDRGENDLENRLDCYESFVQFEIEETGERGYGVAEYSVHPPWPRWLV